MPTTEARKTQITIAHRQVAITADSSGQLPTRIELVKAGTWPMDSNKGELKITVADLEEMKANFDAGIGIPKGLKKLAIDFMHEDYGEAAIWIGSMEIEGKTLYGGDLEYTTKGREALLGGMFKCFSPSFYPGCLGSWHDPEDWSITAKNVIVGGALTNIPFFKSLKPIMASKTSQEESEELLFVDADSERSNMPTLEEVRVKEASALTDEEKNLLVENTDTLTADEKVKFGLEAAAPVADPKVESDNKNTMTTEDAQVLADIRDGKKVLVEASVVTGLQTRVEAAEKQLEESRSKEVSAAVDAHVARGAIKADTRDKWVTRVMADATLLDDLAGIPSNADIKAEKGADAKAVGAVTASQEIKQRADKLVADAKTAGTTLDTAAAYSQVMKADQELAKQYQDELVGKE